MVRTGGATTYLVDESQEDREEDANGPRSDRSTWKGRVVLVVNDGSHLSIGAVIGDQSSLELHLPNQLLVLLGPLENILVVYCRVSPTVAGSHHRCMCVTHQEIHGFS